jgi:hypothetical protein
MLNARNHAALGLRAHSGWAALVVVAGSAAAPTVIDRRRVETADPRIHGAVQPYHAAKDMKLSDAEAFLARCTDAAQQMAETAVKMTVAEIVRKGYAVAGACVLLSSGRPTADLAATLRSHPMIHTAEGHFFRDALKTACESCGLLVLGVKEKELIQQAATTLGISADDLQRRATELGKSVGRPWQQDEKLCAVAAWLALTDLR